MRLSHEASGDEIIADASLLGGATDESEESDHEKKNLLSP